MKVAYLITAHGNYAHLMLLLKALKHPGATIYLHVDQKSELPLDLPDWPELVVLRKRVEVYWAGISQVEATLLLLREAFPHHHDYYILLSGSDYPIRPLNFLFQQLQQGGEFINLIKGYVSHKPPSRVNCFYFQRFNRRSYTNLRTIAFLALEKVLSLFYKRTFPFEPIFHGANWFALSHQCVSYILKYLEDHPEYLEFYSHTIYPDESFFHTIIGQSPFADKVQNNLTYADWSSIPAPANINADHITQFKNQVAFPCESGWHQPYFARKFGPDSQYLVDQIERELRQ